MVEYEKASLHKDIKKKIDKIQYKKCIDFYMARIIRQG